MRGENKEEREFYAKEAVKSNWSKKPKESLEEVFC